MLNDNTTGTQIISINNFSQASYFVEIKIDQKTLGTGTCFFYKRKDRVFLITNWHNVSGINPNSMEREFPEPNKFCVHLFNANTDYAEWIPFEIELYENNQKKWYEKTIDSKYIDVVVMPVDIPLSDYSFYCINDLEEPFNENTKAEISEDVYILGYPYGRTGGFCLPIWKRGSVASEPEVDIDDMPFMYVDTASRPGMSGSPVIRYERRPVVIMDKDKNKNSQYFTKLIGVYSGRYGDKTDINVQLGKVWKAKVIEELLNENI